MLGYGVPTTRRRIVMGQMLIDYGYCVKIYRDETSTFHKAGVLVRTTVP